MVSLTLLSRMDDKKAARIVLAMQRVHQNDLAGYLQGSGGFDVLNLPAIAQREGSFELGFGRLYRRMRREILHPEHESAEVLRELKREMGSIAFDAQYQQNPTPPGGNLIKRKWLQNFYEEIVPQANDQIVMSWDIAMSDGDAAIVKVRCTNQVFHSVRAAT